MWDLLRFSKKILDFALFELSIMNSFGLNNIHDMLGDFDVENPINKEQHLRSWNMQRAFFAIPRVQKGLNAYQRGWCMSTLSPKNTSSFRFTVTENTEQFWSKEAAAAVREKCSFLIVSSGIEGGSRTILLHQMQWRALFHLIWRTEEFVT